PRSHRRAGRQRNRAGGRPFHARRTRARRRGLGRLAGRTDRHDRCRYPGLARRACGNRWADRLRPCPADHPARYRGGRRHFRWLPRRRACRRARPRRGHGAGRGRGGSGLPRQWRPTLHSRYRRDHGPDCHREMTPETLVIERLGHRGEGVATLNGKPVFVPLTLAGETITAQIEGNRGQLIDILAPAPERREAPCPHYGACGGCQLQHLSPDLYLALKRSLVAQALERAGVSAEVKDPIIAHGTGRRRATLHATPKAAGFMALRSHAIHDLDLCPILVPALARAPQIARDIAATLGPCDVAFTASDMGLDVAIRAK